MIRSPGGRNGWRPNRSRAVLSVPPLSTSVDPSLSTTEVPKGSALLRLAQSERQFLILIGLAFFAAGAAFPYPDVARWLGFGLAAYSAIANDSIQTVGVFIASGIGEAICAITLA